MMCYPSFNVETTIPALTGTVVSVGSVLHISFYRGSIIQKDAWKSSCMVRTWQGHWKVLDLTEQGYRAECFVTLDKIPTVPLKWCFVAKRTNSEHDRGHSMF